jgi:hypothetical protein
MATSGRNNWSTYCSWACVLGGLALLGAREASHIGLRRQSVHPSGLSSASWLQRDPSSRVTERVAPFAVRPLTSPLLQVTRSQSEQIRNQILPPRSRGASSSYLLHLLRVHGLDVCYKDERFPSGSQILRTLTDSETGKRYWGNTPLVRTSWGWRFPTGGPEDAARDFSLELHRDQTLAAFAELGLPLNYPLHGDDGEGSLRDVLTDSLANFHLKQKELAWTTLAYALYLPPVQSWSNRYGERYSFDQLVGEMLGRSLEAESCGGTHLLYSLTILARVDQAEPILSDAVRRRLWTTLGNAVRVAVSHQQTDGSWHSGWSYELLPEAAPEGWSFKDEKATRVLLTGHIGEWFLSLPDELRVDPRALEQAGRWLMKELLDASVGLKEAEFCPYTHAARVLHQITFVPEESGSAHPVHGRPAEGLSVL